MNIRLHTSLCEMFNVRYPIFLAGMAGGPTTADLVAAVSKAGGLGTLGAAYMEPAAIRESVRSIRGQTDAPFAVNLFADRSADDNSRIVEAQRQLNSVRDVLGIPHPPESAVATPDRFEEQFAVLLEEKVPVISTAIGVLPEPMMRQAKSAGVRTVAMATTVDEASWPNGRGARPLWRKEARRAGTGERSTSRTIPWARISARLRWYRKLSTA